jgi:hypothetical protein
MSPKVGCMLIFLAVFDMQGLKAVLVARLEEYVANEVAAPGQILFLPHAPIHHSTFNETLRI